jgi:hypothetical protein
MLRFMVLLPYFLTEGWPQGLPGLLTEGASVDRFGPVTGTIGLIPALPISVAPRGIPTRPADDEGRGDRGILLSAHERDVFPESPPPSNGAPDNAAALELAQVPMPTLSEGLTGLMPGVAISVASSGIPAGPADPMASGDVARMPGDCCAEDLVWAMTRAGENQPAPAASHTNTNAIPRDLNRREPWFLDMSRSRIWHAAFIVVLPAD